ncbi:MAG: carboxypeptidase-like regulatory domain-containing protein, partial [Bacteroidetes bacterium]|nr:carboxypeptidase-like regulatory domain-containing protein [Bacteroidota bacterium]
MRKISLLFCFLLQVLVGIAQEKYTISGYLKDAKNGEMLIGATVLVKELGTGTAANVYGFYSISIAKGNYTIVLNYLGYQPITREIILNENLKLDFELSENTQNLEEVIVSSERADANIKNVEMSVNKLDIKTIQKIPALL